MKGDNSAEDTNTARFLCPPMERVLVDAVYTYVNPESPSHRSATVAACEEGLKGGCSDQRFRDFNELLQQHRAGESRAPCLRCCGESRSNATVPASQSSALSTKQRRSPGRKRCIVCDARGDLPTGEAGSCPPIVQLVCNRGKPPPHSWAPSVLCLLQQRHVLAPQSVDTNVLIHRLLSLFLV